MKKKNLSKSIVASVCLVSLMAGGCISQNEANAIWPFSNSQNKIQSDKSSIEGVLNKCATKLGEINSDESKQNYLGSIEKIKKDVEVNVNQHKKLVKSLDDAKELEIQMNFEAQCCKKANEIQAILNQSLEKANLLTSSNDAKEYFNSINELKNQVTNNSKNSKGLDNISSESKSLLDKVTMSFNLQEIEKRNKQEKDERDRLQKLENAKVMLSEKIASLLREMRKTKNIENKEDTDKFISKAKEICDKIGLAISIEMIPEIEVAISEFEEDINLVSARDQEARRVAYEKLLNETKANLKASSDKLSEKISLVNKENLELTELTNSIASLKSDIEDMVDLNEVARFEDKLKNIDSKLSEIIAEQERVEKERIALEIQEKNIENNRNFEKQLELLKDGKIALEDVVGGNKKTVEKSNLLIKSYLRYRTKGNIKPSKGMLLYGPPGTGKTTFVRAFASANDIECFMITPSMVMGADGPDKIVQIIETARKSAKISGKIVMVLIDEIDAIAQVRSSSSSDKVLVSLMNEVDSISSEEGVVFFATTNRKEALDSAIVRTGRFDSSIEVNYPNQDDAAEILKLRCKYLSFGEEIDINYVASKMQKFNGADIGKVVDKALEISLDRNGVDELSKASLLNSDFEAAIATVLEEKSDIFK